MLQGIIRHTFHIPNWVACCAPKHRKGGEMVYEIKPKPTQIKCPKCQCLHELENENENKSNYKKRQQVTLKGEVLREIQTTSCGNKNKNFFLVHVPRIHCKKCKITRQIDTSDIHQPYCTYSKQLEQEVAYKFKKQTIKSTSEEFGLHWHTVATITKRHLEKINIKKRFKNLKYVTIDEKAIGKGQRNYITTVMNPITHETLYVADGKSKESVAPFFEEIGKRRCSKIIAVSLDMGKAYISATKEWLPNSLIVYDHFHIIKIVNKCVDELRKLVFMQATFEQKKIIRGSKYLLLKNPQNLKTITNGEQRLHALLRLNTPLTIMYALKEDIRQIWQCKSYDEAEIALNNWLITAKGTNIFLIQQLAKTIEKFKDGILNWYHAPINSAGIESLNSVIKALIIRARGYKDRSFLKSLIMHYNIAGPQATKLL